MKRRIVVCIMIAQAVAICVLVALLLKPVPPITVRDFGAVGDGVHDDSTAIAAAIRYAVHGTKQHVVLFPAGCYLTCPPISHAPATSAQLAATAEGETQSAELPSP